MPSTAEAVPPPRGLPFQNSQAVVAEVVLSHASFLARVGRLEEAAKVLLELETGGDDVRVLDLLAKIRAQQGHYGDAEAAWARAKALSGNDDYDAGIKRVRALRTKPAWARAAPLVVACVSVAALALILLRSARTAPKSPPTAVVSPLPDVTSPEQRHRSAPVNIRAVPAQVLGDFAGPGIQQKARVGRVDLTFDEGLFLSGASLRGEAVTMIDELGARLGRVPRETVVIITGHTDDIPVAAGKRFRDNAALGLARATVVMDRLVTASGLPASSFLVGTSADEGAPYPNDGRENQLRNRTVTIQVRQDLREP